jgi:hypothetical protein
MDVLIRFFNFGESQKAEGKFVGCALLDVEGAFDDVQSNILDDRLKNSNVQPYLRAWIQNFLTDKHLALTINGHQTGPFPLTRGVSQGSPLSPPLFIIYASPLHKILSSYVDDFMLAVSGSSSSDVQSKLQQAVSQHTTLASKYQIRFSKLKTEIAYFFLPNNIDRDHP